MATAAQLQQQISTAQQNLAANQRTLASLQSQYDAKVISANAPGNSSMRANLLQDAEDLQVEIANSADIVRRQGLAITDLNAQLQEAPVITSDTAANKVANDPPMAEPTVETQGTAATPAPLAENDTLSISEQKNLKVNTAGAGAALNNYDIAPNFGVRRSEVTSSDPIPAATKTNTDNKDPIPNPLLDYPSYTYGLSLALLTVKEYNDLMDDTKSYQSNRVIIASAGRYNNDEGVSMFKRAPFFAEDFYFENLNMTTVIGLNDHSRSTNAINLTFTIIEPYGITLLNRIIELSASVGSVNYIAQPYLLQIDFFGTNDAGEIVGVIPHQTKRIPIRILKMDIKASTKGAEYSMEACPYSHSAFDLGTISTPANFEITSGDIKSFFQSNEPELAFSDAKKQREKLVGANGQFQQAANGTLTQRGGTGEVVSLAFVGNGSAIDTNSISGDAALYKVKSYGGAINAYYINLAATEKIDYYDTYYFNFHEDIIKDGGFNLNAETLSSAQTPMASEENGMSIRGTDQPGSLEHNVRVFAINTGTSIDQVIAFAMRHTHYLQGQVRPASEFPADGVKYKEYLEEKSGQPLKWYKIVPTIKLGLYDIKQETWARTITYNIVPYTIYNTKIADAPQGVWTQPTKVHNYWYTGKNNDVLDFNVEFNALYYTAVTAYRENLSKTQDLLEGKTVNPPLSDSEQQANSVAPLRTKPIIQDTQKHATGGAATVKQIALADIEASLYTGAGGDMLQAKLKIIGDPQYIKQDDVFYPPVLTAVSTQVDNTGLDPRLIANGSLHMDQGEIYVQMTVKSPVDIDESTGMMKFDSKYSTSLFSGMYRVLTVESTFTGGKFEQTLDIVRLPRQKSLEPTGAPKDPNARATTAVTPLLTNADTVPAATPIAAKPGDDKAPGSNPVNDTTPPLQTSEEKALAKVDKTAPETPITTQTEPVATPSPVPPSAEKLALKATSDQARAARDQAQSAANAASATLAKLQSDIEYAQTRIDRYKSTIANPNMSEKLRAGAERDLPLVEAQLPTLQAQLSSVQANYNSLDAANKSAQTAYVNALDAYTRAA